MYQGRVAGALLGVWCGRESCFGPVRAGPVTRTGAGPGLPWLEQCPGWVRNPANGVRVVAMINEMLARVGVTGQNCTVA
jgi:hypothetical protein